MQEMLQFAESWGGRREGSGRARRKTGTAHCARGRLSRHDPVLVTWKRVKGLGSFRQSAEAHIIVEAIKASRRVDFRIVHFSIQSDHLHFLIEADGRQALARGMRGLGCRLGRRLNKLWNRRGKLFAERFHGQTLTSLTQVRNALRYVLNNHLKHGHSSRPGGPDPFSSGDYFDGWSNYARLFDPAHPDSYLSPPGWKLGPGWRTHHAPIRLSHTPG